MAKNIFEKKKRVTRMKSFRNSIDCGDMLPGDVDYVSSIIKNMDTNYEQMKSNNFKINNSTKVTSKTEQNKDEKDKSIPSTSKNPTQLCKFKKFGLNRKFPLMEKSQKVLKQLKHNQSIPKQRAHLSFVPGLPAKSNCSKNTLPIKGKTMHSMANIKRNLSLNKNIHNESCENVQKIKTSLKGTEKSTLKKIEGSQNTNLKSHLNSKNIVPSSTKRPKSSKNLNKASNTSFVSSENLTGSSKKSKLLHEDDFQTYYKRSYFRSNLITKNVTDDRSDSSVHSRSNSSIHNRSNSSVSSRSNSSISSRSNSIVNKESNNFLNDKNNSNISDTTDSEFEKFLERNKTDPQKKSKISRKKAKTVKRHSKKTIRKLSDSESSDDEVSPLKQKKKMKVSDEKLKSKVVMADESEADLIDGDVYTRDSSSESDTSLLNTTCSSLSVQLKENESYVSLPEPKSERDKAKSKVLMTNEFEDVLMDGDMHKRDLPSERDIAHVSTNCSSLCVQSLPEPDAIIVEDNIMDSLHNNQSLHEPNAITVEDNIIDSLHNNQTLPAMYEKACQKQMACANSSLDSDNCAVKDSLIFSENSMFIYEGCKVEKLKNEIPECIELSSSEDECLSSNLCLNSVTEESGKSFINISVFSEAATLNSTAIEQSDFKTVEAILNVPTKDSEESDIEIIDVVVTEPKKAECSIAMDNNCSAISLENNSVNHNVQRIKCEPQTKQLLGIKIKKENEHPKNNVVTDCNHGAVFTTDICKEIDSNDSLKLLQPDSDVTIADKIKYTSSEGSSCNQFTSLRIKKEENDDDVIIIDSAETHLKLGNQKLSSKDTNISSNQDRITIKRELPEVKTKNPIVQKINCQSYLADKQKCENEDLKKEDIKVGEVSSSNILPTKSLRNAALDDFIPSVQINNLNITEKNVTLSQLIELFKQEFQTYQELIEVETNLETRLKQIETKQAGKLMRIRSVIQHILGNGQYEVGGNSSKIDEAIDKMCNLEDLKNLDTKECVHNLVSSCSPKLNSEKKEEILSQKEQNISDKLSLESSPLSFAVENKDEITNFSSLNSSQLKKIKLEPVSAEDSTNKSNVAMKLLGEKCVICCKNAVAACQKCAKVFFCSNECGKKSWNDGHKDECGKL